MSTGQADGVEECEEMMKSNKDYQDTDTSEFCQKKSAPGTSILSVGHIQITYAQKFRFWHLCIQVSSQKLFLFPFSLHSY